MAKIIHKGTVPPVETPWFFEVPIICTYCHTEFLIEPKDQFYEKPDESVSTVCPLCNSHELHYKRRLK